MVAGSPGCPKDRQEWKSERSPLAAVVAFGREQGPAPLQPLSENLLELAGRELWSPSQSLANGQWAQH